MAKYSLCIEPVLTGLDFYDRIKASAELGYDAVEFWDPVGRDISKIARLASENNIKVAICCLKDAWTLRLNFPAQKVLENVRQSIAVAKELGAAALIGLSGDVEGRADSQKNILIENLKRAAELCEREGVVLCVEALNSLVDHKGYYLDSSYVGFEIIKSVNSSHVKLLYDAYHMQIMEGNLIANVTSNLPFIGHFHSAGVPGRNEHFNGETNYPRLIKEIDKAGYNGYFGLEYWPTYEHKESLRACLDYLKTV